MTDFHRRRDEEVMPMYELTFDMAGLEPPPPEAARIISAAAARQESMDAFAKMIAGVTTPGQFFAPEHVEHMLEAAA